MKREDKIRHDTDQKTAGRKAYRRKNHQAIIKAKEALHAKEQREKQKLQVEAEAQAEAETLSQED